MIGASLRSVRAANFRDRKRINLRCIHKRFDGDFLAFGIARSAGWAVVESFDAKSRHHGSVGIPKHRGMLRSFAENATVARLNCLDERMILGNFRARNRNKYLVFNPVLWMLLAKLQHEI